MIFDNNKHLYCFIKMFIVHLIKRKINMAKGTYYPEDEYTEGNYPISNDDKKTLLKSKDIHGHKYMRDFICEIVSIQASKDRILLIQRNKEKGVE